MLSEIIQKELAKVLQKHWQLNPLVAEVTPTKDLTNGDYTTTVALKIASHWGVPPRQTAEQLVEELESSAILNKIVTKIQVAGSGFINFWIKEKVLAEQLSTLTKSQSRALLKKQKIIVEYSSPNIAKPMHIGHIRSTFIGQALANIYEALGARVVRLNHLGDWGTQFGKLLAAYKMWGDKKTIQADPIAELLKLYIRFHEAMKLDPELVKQGQIEFLKLEKGDKANVRVWNWFKRESLKEFNKIYRQLGVKFDYLTGESFYEPMLQGVVKDLLKKKLAIKNADESIVVHLTKEGLPPCLVQKGDGASLYATRDLAAIRYRVKTFKPNLIVYAVGNEQSLHFEQVFALAKKIGYADKTDLRHVKFGLVLGEDGQKLATREGKIIKLEEVLNKAVVLAKEVVEKKNPKLTKQAKTKIAQVVGLGAVKYNDLSQNRQTDITFNWKKMLSLEGNSGPYLQYTYVRLKSILRKAGSATKISQKTLVYTDELDKKLLRKLAQYPEAIVRAAKEQGPHLLALYLYELSAAVNSYYQQAPVLQAPAGLKKSRLKLVKTSADIIKQGLSLLGINVVEKM
ncbi:arginine--tRNA ligase [Patescibacteria group bacterium]|nr:arginine--tRNA ligase [Patescibacteria group bacterium]